MNKKRYWVLVGTPCIIVAVTILMCFHCFHENRKKTGEHFIAESVISSNQLQEEIKNIFPELNNYQISSIQGSLDQNLRGTWIISFVECNVSRPHIITLQSDTQKHIVFDFSKSGYYSKLYEASLPNSLVDSHIVLAKVLKLLPNGFIPAHILAEVVPVSEKNAFVWSVLFYDNNSEIRYFAEVDAVDGSILDFQSV